MIKSCNNSNIWDGFDKFYCISVDERSDRREEALKQFESLGLKDKVEFFIVKKHPVDSEQGIFESHIQCIKKGLDQNARTIVIFEDDVVFDRFEITRLQRSVEFLSLCQDWGIFFFGCLVSNNKETDNDCILKIKYRSLTHAYVISNHFARIVSNQKWNHIAYDEMLRNIQHNFFAIYPSFAFQSNSTTDNDKYLKLDQFRRVFGGLKIIQKMNEFFHRNKPVIIATHALVICIFICLMLLN